jgi:hypothetical protein
MRLDRVKPLEIEHRLDQPRAGRIAVDHGGNVGAEGLGDRGIARDGVEIGLLDEIARKGLVCEPGAQPVDNRRFKRFLIEDRRKDKTGDVRLVTNGVLRLGAHTREHRIGAGKRDDLCRSLDGNHDPPPGELRRCGGG